VSKFIITSLELASGKMAIGCEDRPTADNIADSFKATHHGVAVHEVIPVVLFLPKNSITLDAYKPLPGSRKPVTQ
jgi:hypothetical protein